MPRLARRHSCALVLAFTSAAPVVRAQPAADLPIDPFRPAIDSRGYLTVNASQPLGHGEVSFGLGALSWGHRLLELQGAGATSSVDDVVTATLVAAYGLRLGPAALELAASLPFAIISGERLDAQGLGDAGLHLKTRLLSTSKAPHVGLGVIASLFAPTTRPRARFLGEGRWTPQIVGVVDAHVGRRQRLRVALDAGVRVRPTTTNQTVTASSEAPFGLAVAYAVAPRRLELVAELVGAVPLGEHAGYQPLEALGGVKLYLARSSFLSLGAGRGLAPSKGANPDVRAFIGIVFEPSLGDRDGDGLKDDVDRCPDDPEDADGFEDGDGCPEPDNDRDGILDEDDACPLVPEDRDGVADEDGCPDGETGDRDGDGIRDEVDGCPDDPEDKDGWQDEDGCPDLDNDRDGLVDVDDLCPDEAEDRDRFEDEDGCPEKDNDRDRIVDTDDACPLEPENYNGTEDQDGCKDRGITELGDGVMIILKPIEFEFNSAKLRPSAYEVLDAVVATMLGNPDVTLVEVQGHTDDRGDDAYNLDLSIRRAAAVADYLRAHGVPADRLTSEGYGETMPVVRGRSEQAWAKNRRVEFVILRRAKPL